MVRCLVIMHRHAVLNWLHQQRWARAMPVDEQAVPGEGRTTSGLTNICTQLHRMALSPARVKFTIGPAGVVRPVESHLDGLLCRAAADGVRYSRAITWHSHANSITLTTIPSFKTMVGNLMTFRTGSFPMMARTVRVK